MRQSLERDNLVPGHLIDRHHHDTESEDDKESELESEFESEVEPEDSDEDPEEPEKKVYPIAIGDHEYTSRYAICENGEQKFDVTCNSDRECYWHEGEKELDYDADIWADHDEDWHGLVDSFEYDPTYAEGFK